MLVSYVISKYFLKHINSMNFHSKQEKRKKKKNKQINNILHSFHMGESLVQVKGGGWAKA